MKIKSLTLLICLSIFACCQGKTVKESTKETAIHKKGNYPIAFYNVENLFDTKRDKSIYDTEFTPSGAKKWTADKYKKKLANLASAISKLGLDENKDGACIVGLAEIENENVLKDLLATPPLNKKGYKYAHFDSPDPRGIDVALIYNPDYFNFVSKTKYTYGFRTGSKKRQRDHLLVSGTIGGEPIRIIVNHWASRKDREADAFREVSALNCKHISDSIRRANPKAKVIIMGDLNDDPFDKSVRVALGAKKETSKLKRGDLYNPMWNILEKGIGSLRYQGKWNLFDQIIISENLVSNDTNSLRYVKAQVYNPDYLFQQSGRFKGYPFRSFSGHTFINGYSDHFPVIIYLKK